MIKAMVVVALMLLAGCEGCQGKDKCSFLFFGCPWDETR